MPRVKFTNPINVPQRLHVSGTGALQRRPLHRAEDVRIGDTVKGDAAPHKYLRAQGLQGRRDRIDKRQDQGEENQRRYAAARQNAVIDLQHIEGSR